MVYCHTTRWNHSYSGKLFLKFGVIYNGCHNCERSAFICLTAHLILFDGFLSSQMAHPFPHPHIRPPSFRPHFCFHPSYSLRRASLFESIHSLFYSALKIGQMRRTAILYLASPSFHKYRLPTFVFWSVHWSIVCYLFSRHWLDHLNNKCKYVFIYLCNFTSLLGMYLVVNFKFLSFYFAFKFCSQRDLKRC